MSLISLLLSSKEVILSLVVIGFIGFIIVMLVITPVLQRRWKKIVVRQRAKKVAEIARAKKNQSNKQRANAAARKRSLEATMQQIAPVDDGAAIGLDEASSLPVVDVATETVEEAAIEIPSSLQNVLDSVFIDEDANLRLQVLLKGTEPVSAQELVDLADNVLSHFTFLDAEKVRD